MARRSGSAILQGCGCEQDLEEEEAGEDRAIVQQIREAGRVASVKNQKECTLGMILSSLYSSSNFMLTSVFRANHLAEGQSISLLYSLSHFFRVNLCKLFMHFVLQAINRVQ